jgi:hypothetical protein
MIPSDDGRTTQHERFASASLDDSIARGGQFLDIDHSGVALGGRFLSLREDGRELRFRYALTDGPRERALLRQLPYAKGCSVLFRPDPAATRYVDGRLWEYRRATLVEISIVTSGAPAWYGSRVAIEQ